jgi:hypothetical protein
MCCAASDVVADCCRVCSPVAPPVCAALVSGVQWLWAAELVAQSNLVWDCVAIRLLCPMGASISGHLLCFPNPRRLQNRGLLASVFWNEVQCWPFFRFMLCRALRWQRAGTTWILCYYDPRRPVA